MTAVPRVRVDLPGDGVYLVKPTLDIPAAARWNYGDEAFDFDGEH